VTDHDGIDSTVAAAPDHDGSARARRGRPSAQTSAAITSTILQVASDMFARDGFDSTTMEAVAVRAGVPKVTLYKRFADKGKLLDAVLHDKVRDWGRAAVRDGPKPPDDLGPRLAHYIVIVMTWSINPEVRTFMRLAAAAYGYSGQRANTRAFFAYDGLFNQIVQDIARLGPPQGIAIADPARFTSTLMLFISGWLDSVPDDQDVPANTIQAEADYLVDILLNGACMRRRGQ
jgi:AcrR family transcriptional regulator